MGTNFRFGGSADFSDNSTGLILPVATGCLGWFYLGGTQAATQQDRAGIANATLVGSPTIGDGFVSFGGFDSSKWLQTAIAETSEFTVLCVARSDDTFAGASTKPMFFSNYGADAGNGGALIGASIYVDGGTAPAGLVRLGGGQNNNGTKQGHISTSFTTTDVSEFNFYAGRMAQTDSNIAASNNARNLFNKTTAQTNSLNCYPRVPHSANLMRVGAAFNSSFNGNCDVSFAAAYSRVLTDDEIETIYQSVKTRLLLKHSITI